MNFIPHTTLAVWDILTLYSSIADVHSSVVVDGGSSNRVKVEVTLTSVSSHLVEVSLTCTLFTLVVF